MNCPKCNSKKIEYVEKQGSNEYWCDNCGCSWYLVPEDSPLFEILRGKFIMD